MEFRINLQKKENLDEVRQNYISDGLAPNPGELLGGPYLPAEKQSVYSTTTADWTRTLLVIHIYKVEFSGEEVIVLPLAFVASLFIYELRSR